MHYYRENHLVTKKDTLLSALLGGTCFNAKKKRSDQIDILLLLISFSRDKPLGDTYQWFGLHDSNDVDVIRKFAISFKISYKVVFKFHRHASKFFNIFFSRTRIKLTFINVNFPKIQCQKLQTFLYER